jgi:D-3-phosphoglycerate dehydrogenase
MRILATDGMDKSGVLALKEMGHEVVEQFYSPEELATKVRDFDVLVVRSATKVRVPIIDAAKGSKLKLIIRGGVGVDNIDVDYAEANGIAVRNTPRASSDSVAELALAHMFSCARFISIAGHTMREGKWEKKAYGAGIELSGKTIGIIGYGRIGQALGRRCMALGMTVLAYDVYKIPSLECESMKYVELNELLEKSDFVSLHTPSLEGKPLINTETIATMKTGAVLINTSRGTNIDEAALIEALDSGKLRGAGIDVYAEEPSKNETLLNHPKISCTPHIGAATGEAQKRIGAEIVEIIANFKK